MTKKELIDSLDKIPDDCNIAFVCDFDNFHHVNTVKYLQHNYVEFVFRKSTPEDDLFSKRFSKLAEKNPDLIWDYDGWRKIKEHNNPYNPFTQHTWNITLHTAINSVSRKMGWYSDTLIVSCEAGAILEDNPHYMPLPQEPNTNKSIVEGVGLLSGQFKIYKDPNLPNSTIIIGRQSELFNLNIKPQVAIVHIDFINLDGLRDIVKSVEILNEDNAEKFITFFNAEFLRRFGVSHWILKSGVDLSRYYGKSFKDVAEELGQVDYDSDSDYFKNIES